MVALAAVRSAAAASSRQQQVDRADNVDLGGRARVFDRVRHARDGAQMQHEAHTGERPLNGLGIAQVALNNLRLVGERTDVLALATGKIIKHAHALPLPYEMLRDV